MFLRTAREGCVPIYDPVEARFALEPPNFWLTQDKLICVDSDDGDDSASGSATDPIRTIARAYELMGPISRDVQIRLAGNTRHAMPRWGAPKIFRRLLFWGTDKTFTTDAVDTIAGGVLDGGNSLTRVNIAGLVEDAHRMQQFRLTSGVCAGIRRTIPYHGDDELVFSAALPSGSFPVSPANAPPGGIPSAGDSYEIFRPHVQIDVSAATKAANFDGFHRTSSYDMLIGAGGGFGGDHDSQRPGVIFVNLSFRHNSPDHCTPSIVGCNVFFYGVEYVVEVTKTSGFHFTNCVVFCGADHSDGEDAQIPQDAPFNTPVYYPESRWWSGYGLAFDGSAAANTYAFQGSAQFQGHIVATGSSSGCRLDFGSQAYSSLAGGSLYNGSATTLTNGLFFVTGHGEPIRFKNTNNQSPIWLPYGGIASLYNTDLSAVAPCIFAARNAVVDSANLVTGQSTGGTSVLAKHGARVHFFGAPALGDAVALDYAVLGGTASVNKSAFAADGSSLSGSGYIERLDISI